MQETSEYQEQSALQGLLNENKLLKDENQKLITEKEKYRTELLAVKTVYRQHVDDSKIESFEHSDNGQGKLFERYKNVLGEPVLEELRQLNGEQKNDSTFFLKVMRRLYRNTAVLGTLTAKGTDGKSMMSPTKRRIIDGIFLERLEHANSGQDEVDMKRLSKVSRLINSARNNILKVRQIN